jgi:hypothetical protein
LAAGLPLEVSGGRGAPGKTLKVSVSEPRSRASELFAFRRPEKKNLPFFANFFSLQYTHTTLTEEASGILPKPDEFYFTTAEKKLLENCRCIVPNFNND